MEFFIGATFGLGVVNFALSLYITRLLITADNRRIIAEERRQAGLTMRVPGNERMQNTGRVAELDEHWIAGSY